MTDYVSIDIEKLTYRIHRALPTEILETDTPATIWTTSDLGCTHETYRLCPVYGNSRFEMSTAKNRKLAPTSRVTIEREWGLEQNDVEGKCQITFDVEGGIVNSDSFRVKVIQPRAFTASEKETHEMAEARYNIFRAKDKTHTDQ